MFPPTNRFLPHKSTRTRLLAALLAVAALSPAFVGAAAPSSASAAKAILPFRGAAAILRTLRADLIPPDLRSKSPQSLSASWPRWAAREDRAIRARLVRGDEDSVVNFLLFGVTFTTLPRIQLGDLLAQTPPAAELLRNRIMALADAVRSSGSNERLRFVRSVIERHGISVATAAGRSRTQTYLLELTSRVLADIVRYDPRLHADARDETTLFRDRGLASDTAIAANFSVDAAIRELAKSDILKAGTAGRVAIVGPGLEFIDKYEGYDFYPQQTIQPFAVVDSLAAAGVADVADVRVMTFDLNPRVNQHIESARKRAQTGGRYVVQLARPASQSWSTDLIAYWERFGNRIGDPADAAAVPPSASGVRIRAVSVRPEVARSFVPRDLDIVVERLSLDRTQHFDLVVATNILVYYDGFEQLLAMTNIASMLRPGGVLLCNDVLPLLPAVPLRLAGQTDVIFDTDLHSGDRVRWYVRD